MRISILYNMCSLLYFNVYSTYMRITLCSIIYNIYIFFHFDIILHANSTALRGTRVAWDIDVPRLWTVYEKPSCLHEHLPLRCHRRLLPLDLSSPVFPTPRRHRPSSLFYACILMRCHPYFSLYTSACPIPRELFMTHRPLAAATPSSPSLTQPARRTEIHFGFHTLRTAAVVRTLLLFIVFSYRERGKRWSYAIIGFVGTEENIKSTHNENRSRIIPCCYVRRARTYISCSRRAARRWSEEERKETRGHQPDRTATPIAPIDSTVVDISIPQKSVYPPAVGLGQARWWRSNACERSSV